MFLLGQIKTIALAIGRMNPLAYESFRRNNMLPNPHRSWGRLAESSYFLLRLDLVLEATISESCPLMPRLRSASGRLEPCLSSEPFSTSIWMPFLLRSSSSTSPI